MSGGLGAEVDGLEESYLRGHAGCRSCPPLFSKLRRLLLRRGGRRSCPPPCSALPARTWSSGWRWRGAEAELWEAVRRLDGRTSAKTRYG